MKKYFLCFQFTSPYWQLLKQAISTIVIPTKARTKLKVRGRLVKYTTNSRKKIKTILRSPHVNKNAQETFGTVYYQGRYTILLRRLKTVRNYMRNIKQAYFKYCTKGLTLSGTITRKIRFVTKF